MNSFKDKIKKVSGNRYHTITNSFGVKDAYIYYKHNRPQDKEFVISDSTYRALIRDVNRLLVNQLLNVGEIKLPVDLGYIKIYKKENKPIIKDGKVYYNAPVNWGKTLELWESDNESRVAKTLVKVMPGDIYTVKYKNQYCKFKNKGYYSFKVNRNVKALLKEKIDNKETIPYFTTMKKI